MKTAHIFTILCFGISLAHAVTFNIPDASEEYKLAIIAECEDGQCSGPAEVEVMRKNGSLIQTIKTPDLAILLDRSGKPKINDTILYGDQSAAVVDDFNFDGLTDLAIRNGNNSAYGGPSYDVYVYNRSKQKFVPSAELTELATTNLGMFKVDTANKRLITYEKSGCCWHLTTQYAVAPGCGFYVTYSKEEAVTPDGEHVDVTVSRLVGKKMLSKKKRHLTSAYYK